jgi:hypothetical protein
MSVNRPKQAGCPRCGGAGEIDKAIFGIFDCPQCHGTDKVAAKPLPSYYDVDYVGCNCSCHSAFSSASGCEHCTIKPENVSAPSPAPVDQPDPRDAALGALADVIVNNDVIREQVLGRIRALLGESHE